MNSQQGNAKGNQEDISFYSSYNAYYPEINNEHILVRKWLERSSNPLSVGEYISAAIMEDVEIPEKPECRYTI